MAVHDRTAPEVCEAASANAPPRAGAARWNVAIRLKSRRSCAPSYRFCRTRFYGTHWVMSRPSDGALRVGRTCVFIGDCGRVEASSLLSGLILYNSFPAATD